MTIRDPRCVDGDCTFPECPCEFPPHDAEHNMKYYCIEAIMIAFPIACVITFGIFYLFNEVL